MDSYDEWHAFFLGEVEKIGGGPWRMSFLEIRETLVRKSNTLDPKIRVFAATRSWPPRTEPERLEACARLACAIEWCETLMTLTDASEPLTPKALESVLIEYWLDVGRETWLKTLVWPDECCG